jgi:hypothetical protein
MAKVHHRCQALFVLLLEDFCYSFDAPDRRADKLRKWILRAFIQKGCSFDSTRAGLVNFAGQSSRSH